MGVKRNGLLSSKKFKKECETYYGKRKTFL